jgi:Na+/melibiose symporter-like transporter
LNRFLLEEAYPSEICRTHNQPADAKRGFRVSSGLLTGILFAICTVLLACYQLNKATTIQMADELAERRKKFAANNPSAA